MINDMKYDRYIKANIANFYSCLNCRNLRFLTFGISQNYWLRMCPNKSLRWILYRLPGGNKR